MPFKSKPFYLSISFLSVGVLLAVFQNCGEIRPAKEAMSAQASVETRIKNDRDTLRRVLSSGMLKVWFSAKDAAVDSLSQTVTSITSRNGGLELTSQGFTQGPALRNLTSGSKLLSFANDGGLATVDTVASTTHSIVLLVDGVSSGRLVTLASGTTNVEELSLSVSGGVLSAVHSSTANDNVRRSHTLGAQSGPRVIAVSYSEAADGISVLVDGQIVRDGLTTTGSPTSSSMIQRRIVIGDVAATFEVAEAMVLTEALKPSELNTLSRYIAESWGYTGVIYDPSLEPSLDGDENSDRMPANVMAILESKCTSCHAHTNWIDSKSYFVGQGLVVSGSYLSSKLYYRLLGSEGSNPNKDMPVGGSISPAEIETIKNWIQSL